jgi:hypothetical protein
MATHHTEADLPKVNDGSGLPVSRTDLPSASPAARKQTFPTSAMSHARPHGRCDPYISRRQQRAGLSRSVKDDAARRRARPPEAVLEGPDQACDRFAVRCEDGALPRRRASPQSANTSVIPRFMRGTHLSAARALRAFTLTWKLNDGSRA